MRVGILLQDGARPRTTVSTHRKLEQLNWRTLEHHFYSPNLRSFNFHVFATLQEALGSQRFNDDVDVEIHVYNWRWTQATSYQSYLGKMCFESRSICRKITCFFLSNQFRLYFKTQIPACIEKGGGENKWLPHHIKKHSKSNSLFWAHINFITLNKHISFV